MGKEKRTLSFGQKMQIAEKLKPVVDVVGDQCKYHKGYNDIIIAEEMDFDCGSQSVGIIRKELFGKLHRPAIRRPSQAKFEETDIRLKKVEDRLDKFEDILGRIVRRNAGQE